MKLIFAIFLFLFASLSYATNDTGIVQEIYIDEGGAVAIKLVEGFPNSVVASECSTNNGYAGNLAADSALKAALLAAKATGSTVVVSIDGCDAGGAWLKVVAVYIK